MECVAGSACSTSAKWCGWRPCSGVSPENVGVSVCNVSRSSGRVGGRMGLVQRGRVGAVEQGRSGRRAATRCSMSGNSMQFVALHQLSEWLSTQGFPNQVR